MVLLDWMLLKKWTIAFISFIVNEKLIIKHKAHPLLEQGYINKFIKCLLNVEKTKINKHYHATGNILLCGWRFETATNITMYITEDTLLGDFSLQNY